MYDSMCRSGETAVCMTLCAGVGETAVFTTVCTGVGIWLYVCTAVCKGVGKRLHTLPIYPILGGPKLQALVYDILPSTTAVFSYAIGPRKVSANE